eukprot:scaffold273721_cov36-Tisochrysis_lutea.AAC.1
MQEHTGSGRLTPDDLINVLPRCACDPPSHREHRDAPWPRARHRELSRRRRRLALAYGALRETISTTKKGAASARAAKPEDRCSRGRAPHNKGCHVRETHGARAGAKHAAPGTWGGGEPSLQLPPAGHALLSKQGLGKVGHPVG